MNKKNCSRCHEEKDLSMFHHDGILPTGEQRYRSSCKPCTSKKAGKCSFVNPKEGPKCMNEIAQLNHIIETLKNQLKDVNSKTLSNHDKLIEINIKLSGTIIELNGTVFELKESIEILENNVILQK